MLKRRKSTREIWNVYWDKKWAEERKERKYPRYLSNGYIVKKR